jgi:hypothetical protein
MANVNAPNGFTPAYHLTGGTIRSKEYRIADDYATAIFSGDLVKLVAGGTIEVAGEGDSVIGVFAGCSFAKDNGEITFSKHWPAAQSVSGSYATAYVYDDPSIVYAAQMEGASGIADIGQLADMDDANSGSTVTGRSAQQISSTTGTSTAQLRILDFVNTPDNDPASNYARVYVQIVEHDYAESPAGTGI